MGDHKLYSDEEIIGRIYLQYCELAGGIPKDKKDDISKIILSIMHKLSILKYHKENYKNKMHNKLSSLKIKLRKNKDTPDKIPQDENIDLIAEAEAFVFQIKSCLDILVKLLSPICDFSYGSVYTFGNKGEDIIKLLKNNISRKTCDGNKIDLLITIINDNKNGWLENVIKLRDTLNHEEPLKNFIIRIARLPNKELIATSPKINNIDVSDLLDNIYGNCIHFIQDFYVNAIILMFPGIYTAKADEITISREYGEKFVKYIKYGFTINTTSSGGTAGFVNLGEDQ